MPNLLKSHWVLILPSCSKLPMLSCATRGEHMRQRSTLSTVSPMSAVGSPRHTNILEEDLPQETMHLERGTLAKRATDAIKSDEVQMCLPANATLTV